MFIVEGNIGAGKSTFLKLMQQQLPHISTALEPVALWDNADQGSSLLDHFMHDTQRWSYTMETFTMMCRVREHLHYQRQEVNNQFLIVERSIYSGHYIFARNGYQQGFMNRQEWQMYLRFFRYLIPGWCKPPQGFVYVRTNPEIAFSRIQKRKRASEMGISLAYLQQVHGMHEQFLINKEGVLEELRTVPVLVLDGNLEFEDDPHVAWAHSQQLAAFLEQPVPL